jgi:hypothetical protein
MRKWRLVVATLLILLGITFIISGVIAQHHKTAFWNNLFLISGLGALGGLATSSKLLFEEKMTGIEYMIVIVLIAIIVALHFSWL